MALDPQLELGFEILKSLGIFGGGAIILIKMGKMMGSFEEIGKQQAKEISEVKGQVKELNALITSVAVQKVEIANIHQDFTLIRQEISELRHGRGYIRDG